MVLCDESDCFCENMDLGKAPAKHPGDGPGAECPICLEPLCRRRGGLGSFAVEALGGLDALRSTPMAFVADTAICLHFLCNNCAPGVLRISKASSRAEDGSFV